MLKKEIKATLQLLLFFLVCVTVLPKMLSEIFPGFEYFEYFLLIYQLAMLLYAMFLGLFLFLPERNHRVVEFIMSATLSRTRLLALKIVPRVLSILLLHLLYLCVSRIPSASISLYPQAMLLTVYLVVFIISASLSLSSSSYFKVFCLVLVLISTLVILEYHIYTLCSDAGQELVPIFTAELETRTIGRFFSLNVLLIIPIILSFIRAFLKEGAYVTANFNGIFFRLMGKSSVYGAFFAATLLYLTSSPVDSEFYLSKRKLLIETSYTATMVRSSTDKEVGRAIIKEGRKITGAITNITESSDSIFYGHYENRNFTFNRIGSTTRSEELYRTRSYNKQFSKLFLFNNSIAFIEGDEGGKFLKTIHLEHRDSISKTRLSSIDFPRQTKATLFGAAENKQGKFWLLTCDNCRGQLYTVSRVYENGRSEGFKSNWSYPIFIGGRILDTHDGTIYSKGLNGSWRRIRTWGKDVKLFVYGGIGDNNRRFDLSRDAQWVYGSFVREKKTIFFHLDNFKLIEDKELTTKAAGLKGLSCGVYCFNGEAYFIAYSGEKKLHSVREVYRIGKRGELSLERRFPGETVEGGRYILNNGIINKSEDFIKVYTFPGLEEVKYRL